MRTWLLHPIVFYPLAALIAALAIAISARPLSWPRDAQAVAGQHAGAAIVLAQGAFIAGSATFLVVQAVNRLIAPEPVEPILP